MQVSGGLTTRKSSDFSKWYTEVILKSKFADYTAVSGCLAFRPAAYFVWQAIQQATDQEFRKHGIENVYFPLFIPERLLRLEQEHVAGFSPEVAWVTMAGDTELEERLAVRPTSEAIMYERYAQWIRSWRDLPMRYNQWNNVVRWEFKYPVPFLRGREFLWNEGHSVFATADEAMSERNEILGIYQRICEECLALKGIVGRKTDKEKFAGAVASYSIEFLLPDGYAIQGPDFHYDGQNFSKAFGIKFLGKDGKQEFAYQNTWAISTRMLGVMIAVHGDDKGLVIPPKVAPIQVVIVLILTEKEKERVIEMGGQIKSLLSGHFRVILDDREQYTPGWKFNEWELKGVPLRLEIGPKDIRVNQVVLVRRDTGEKIVARLTNLVETVSDILNGIHNELLRRSMVFLEENISYADNYQSLRDILSQKRGIVRAPWCGNRKCEDSVKEETGAKIINCPMDENVPRAKCVICGEEAKIMANFAGSY